MSRSSIAVQGSKRTLDGVPPSFSASHRGDSSLALHTDDRKRTALLPTGANTTHNAPNSLLDSILSSPIALDDVGGVAATGAKLDKLDKLGPSLLEVLTYVHPPQPKSQPPDHDSAEDVTDESNYEADSDVHTRANPKFDTSLSRSAILARLTDPSVDNTRKIQECFAKILEKVKCEATGLVLLQDSTVLIFLETNADDFLAISRHLAQTQNVLDVASMRVLASCDDNPIRLLQGLYFRKILVNRPAGDANEWNDDSLRQLAVDTFLNLIKFVKRISPMPPAEIRKVLTNLSNSDQMCLPSNDLVLWLLGREDVMTLGDFLELYDSPILVELESERVWPVHPLFQY